MEFWERFRDLNKPNPVWEEQAYYGGYRWIEFMEGVWINRALECETQALINRLSITGQLPCNFCCIERLLKILKNAGVLKTPFGEESESTGEFDQVSWLSEDKLVLRNKMYQISEIAKTVRFLSKQRTVTVFESNRNTAELVQMLYSRGVKVETGGLSSGVYTAFLNASETSRVVIAKEAVKLRSQINNWGNIVVL